MMPSLSRTRTIICHDPRETVALGRALGRVAPGGAVLGLIGSLGSGKTTLTKGFVSSFGVPRATSPTFVLVKEMPVRRGVVRRVIHADLYRLPPGTNLHETGLADGIGRPDTISVIEWADRLATKPKNLQFIRCSILGRRHRAVRLSPIVAGWLTRTPARRVRVLASWSRGRRYPRR